ncbi:hypothetical protein DM02DRAFT_656566 [Periconia macrospinosa]|uniref:Uncharacterized protein n=1 Tax=Periconia macrospinosa TaxID=97972 RepID=A0A2V1DMF8_9PLEO|nr:hypothetical protein DM02DRAFT_656566 [Periconia macrospinosa]
MSPEMHPQRAIDAVTKKAVSTPSSGAATPSHSDTHKSHKSVKQLWKEIKHAVVEHHRGVNAAYASYYGAGAGSTVPGRRGS